MEQRRMPRVLWVALVMLGLMFAQCVWLGVANLRGHLAVYAGALICLVLLIGLPTGGKWAYMLAIVFAAGGSYYAFTKNLRAGILFLIAGCLVLVPVLLATRFFFPSQDKSYDGT